MEKLMKITSKALVYGVICFLLFGFSTANYGFAADCFKVDKKQTKITWTAFKFTEKVGVKGSFDEIHIATPQKTDSIENLFSATSFSIATKSVNSGNKLRDAKLAVHFFQNLAGPHYITGYFYDYQKNKNKTADVHVRLQIGEEGETVSLAVEQKKEKNRLILYARGSIDILSFNGNKALKEINKACEDQHKGKDGKSKTWSDVDLEVKVVLNTTC